MTIYKLLGIFSYFQEPKRKLPDDVTAINDDVGKMTDECCV